MVRHLAIVLGSILSIDAVIPSGPGADDRWQRIKALFSAAMNEPADERDAWLREAADGVDADRMVEIVKEGLALYPKDAAVYIRPMYWGIDGDSTAIVPQENSTGFAICLEEIPMAPETASVTLSTTRFRRPVLESAVVNAKAGCLYPNNARMLTEARAKGFANALVADAMGNVAETATSNAFLVKDGVVFTPVPNGTFLAGITRARHIANMRGAGIEVHETVLTFDDFHDADEVFVSGNMTKLTPVTTFEETTYQVGPVTKRIREMYWDWAHSRV